MSLNLEVQILGEYKNLTKATRGATNQLKKFQGSTRSISRSINATLATIGVGLSVNAITSGIRGAVSEASNLEESINAVKVAFGGASESVLAIGENAASSFGLAQSQFNAAAVTFSAFADDIVGPGGDVADFIEDITQRGADFASVFNTDVDEALRVFRSGLSGESEPLKRFGIILNETAVKTFAYERGIAAVGSQLTNAEKVQARYALLLEETSKTQGDFANTSDSLANSLRIARAGFADVQVAIGQGFTPAISTAAQFVSDNIETFENLGDAIGVKLREAFEGTGDSATTFGAKIITTLEQLTAFLEGSASASNPFKKAQDELEPFLELLGAFGELGKGVIAVIDGLFDGLFGWIGLLNGGESTIGGFAGFVRFLGETLQNVGYWFGQIISFLVPFTGGFKIAGAALGTFSKTARGIGDFFGGLGKKFTGFFKTSKKNVDDVTKAVDKYDDVMAKAGSRPSPLDPIVKESGKVEDALDAAQRRLRLLDPAADGVRKTFEGYVPQLRRIDSGLGVVRSSIGAVGGATDQIKAKFDAYTASLDAQDGRRIRNYIDVTVTTTTRSGPFQGPGIDPDTGESLVGTDAFKEAQQAIIDANKKQNTEFGSGLTTFQKNVQKLIDTLTDTLEEARARIKNASENFRDGVQLSFGVITNGAFAVFDVNRVIRQMRRLVDGAKNFAKDIKALQSQGADQSLIDQLLGMDPLSGAATARGLLSSGRLGEFLDIRGELADIGAAAGGVANFGINGTGTGGLSNAIDTLTKTLNKGYGNTYNINVNNANKMSGQEIVAAIKKYEKTSGRAVLT